MYLGQERWGQAGGCGAQGGKGGWGGGMGKGQVVPPQMQAPMQQMGAAQNEVGAAVHVAFTGCVNEVVGPIIRGDYTRFCVNHGKPAFKKAAAPGGMEVQIYFWDERDGPAASGWWIGPKLGSDHVWGFHPDKNARTPPCKGWQVPHSGPADPTCVLTPKGGAPGGAPQPGPPQGMGAPGGKGMMGGPPQWQQQQQQQQQWQQQQQQQQQQMQAQREAQQRARMEQVKKQQEELRRKQEEQKKAQAEALEKKRKEGQAMAQIRQKIIKMKSSTPENVEANMAEYQAALAEQLPACGTQQAAITAEGEKAVEATKARIAQIEERKRKAEEAKAEQERKKQEAATAAEEASGELEKLIEAAEKASEAVKKEAEPLLEGKDLTAKALATKAGAIEVRTSAAADALKACQECVSSKASVLNSPLLVPDMKASISKLKAKISEISKGNLQVSGKVRVGKEAAEKKIAAKAITAKLDSLFAKYDKDKDGMLSKAELLSYAKGEFKFTVPGATADVIVKNLAGGAKGVKKDLFQKLKVQVGIAREKARDEVRKTERLEKEKRLEAAKAALTEKFEGATPAVNETDELIVAAEKKATPLGLKQKSMPATELSALAAEIDEAVTAAKEKLASTKEMLKKLTEDVDSDLTVWVNSKLRMVESKISRGESRLNKATATANRLREDGKKKDLAELILLEKKVIEMIKYHKTAKSLDNEALLNALSKKDAISEADLVAFFKTIEKEPAKEGEEEAPAPSPEELKRVFARLDEEGSGSIAKEAFNNNIRVFMKVTKETAMTSTLEIKDSKSLRKLEVGEVVEILEGPVKEDTVEVMRVRAKAMSDDTEGWITTEGNKGTSFLSPGGNLFKVVKETILTETFSLEESKDTTRKLKVGEIVEVKEWAKKEEKSGLMRMKCKCKSDGAVGYATATGNTGTVFLQVV